MLQTKQILVIGNSMVGHHFVDQLGAKDQILSNPAVGQTIGLCFA